MNIGIACNIDEKNEIELNKAIEESNKRINEMKKIAIEKEKEREIEIKKRAEERKNKFNKAIEEALSQFYQALPCFHLATQLRPVEPIYYLNILDTFDQMKKIYEQRSGQTPEELANQLKEGQSLLTHRVQAAWLAMVFAKDKDKNKGRGTHRLFRQPIKK